MTRKEICDLIAGIYPDETIREMYDKHGDPKNDAHEQGDSIALFLIGSIGDLTSDDGNTEDALQMIVQAIDVAIDDLAGVRNELETSVIAAQHADLAQAKTGG